jgi:hypothetical protein
LRTDMNASHKVTLFREMHVNFNFGPGVNLSELLSNRLALKINSNSGQNF